MSVESYKLIPCPVILRNAWTHSNKLQPVKDDQSSFATRVMKSHRSTAPASLRSPRRSTVSRVSSQSFPCSCFLTTLLSSGAAMSTVHEIWQNLLLWNRNVLSTSCILPVLISLFSYWSTTVILGERIIAVLIFVFFKVLEEILYIRVGKIQEPNILLQGGILRWARWFVVSICDCLMLTLI